MWLVHGNTWHHITFQPKPLQSQISHVKVTKLYILYSYWTSHCSWEANCVNMFSSESNTTCSVGLLIIVVFTLIKHCNNLPSSHSYLLPGPCDSGGGSVLQAGRFLSLCSPPASPPLLGHRPERPVHQSLLQHWGGHLPVLPAPTEEHEWQEAGLSGVASDFTGPPQAHIQRGGALWVLIRIIQRQCYIIKININMQRPSKHLRNLFKYWKHFQSFTSCFYHCQHYDKQEETS